MRWPEGPPHLALNPPYLFLYVLLCFLFFVFVFYFLFFASHCKNGFPLKKGIILSIFECFPLFLLSLLWPPTFSISLSLCLSCSFLSFFLPSCLSFFLSCGSLFLSLSFLFFLLCFSFMKGTTCKYSITMFFHQCFLFFGFPVLFSLSSPFLLSLFS